MYTDRCAKLLAKYGAEIETADREPTDFAFSKDDPLGCVYEPPRDESESEEDWGRRVGKGRCSSLDSWLCSKWGIRGAFEWLNPDNERFAGLWKGSSRTVSFVVSGDRKNNSTTPAVEFDLARPLGPQLRAAEQALAQQQKELKKQGIIGKVADGRAA